MTIQEFVQVGRLKIKEAAIQCADPLLHMKQICGAVLGLDAAQLILQWERSLSESELADLEKFLSRRLTGEPFQYILGHEWFWEDQFAVGPGVFIPRKETELIVEHLLKFESRNDILVGELGAGSGMIGLSVLREREGWSWEAYEANPDSIPYLTQNWKNVLGGQPRYQIIQGDFFDLAKGPFDWLVSNPPYVPKGEISTLAKEIHHEPSLALDGGEVGMDVIDRLVAESHRWLRPGGKIILEIGAEQGDLTSRVLDLGGFVEIEVHQDYAGLPRMVTAKRSDNASTND